MNTIQRRFSALETTDFVNVSFFTLLALAMIGCARAIPLWWMYVLFDIAVIIAIFVLAIKASTRGHRWRLVHGFYMMLCIPIAFSQAYHLVPALNPNDIDQVLIGIDRAVFGVNPTQWLFRFSHPVLTEILQLCYATFYFLPLVLAVDLYRKKRMHAFRTVFLVTTFGFYLSYFGYAAFPAIGPRFTLHEFQNTETELPGVLLTNALRIYTNTGESIPPGTVHPERTVQRDAFPSGHTQMTLLVMFLAFRYRARTRWWLWIVGSLLLVATVYLRYHYVVDLAAGTVFAIATYPLALALDRRFKKWKAQGTQDEADEIAAGA